MVVGRRARHVLEEESPDARAVLPMETEEKSAGQTDGIVVAEGDTGKGTVKEMEKVGVEGEDDDEELPDLPLPKGYGVENKRGFAIF